MKIVEPKVFHIAQTNLIEVGANDFLQHHKVPDWETDAKTGAECLIEIAGRRCYQSWETPTKKAEESNPNLTKVRVGNQTYISNILKTKHGSVLEHAHDTFAIEGVSRVFTHEVVRHRLCNFSQESLRFVRPTQLYAYFPDAFAELPEPQHKAVAEIFAMTFTDLEAVQKDLVAALGDELVGKTFGRKKKLQSSMRRLMPIGMSTGIIMTTNHRNWRHLITMRTHPSAEEEIREVFGMIADILYRAYPALYQDMKRKYENGCDECWFESERV